MLKDLTKTQGTQLGITVLLLVFALALIFYTVRNMDASVKSVVSGMQEVKNGNLDVVVPVQSFDEIGTIADNFNEMTVKVRELIREVTEAEENRKNAEIRALEAQINPQFLYNTLDSINWRAKAIHADDISQICTSLGSLLRITLHKDMGNFTVGEEMQLVSNYMTIQHMRYPNKLIYHCDVSENLYTISIPKFTINLLWKMPFGISAAGYNSANYF